MAKLIITEFLSSLEARKTTAAAAAAAAELSEAKRIEALASDGNRRLLFAIAQSRPGSITELARLVGREQSNVSRSLTALKRVNLVDLHSDGRASTPTLTEEGSRWVVELAGTSSAAGHDDALEAEASSSAIVSVRLDEAGGDIIEDKLQGDLSFKWAGLRTADRTDVYDVAYRLLSNWWRVVHRRDDPFRVFTLLLCDGESRTNHSVAFLSRVIGERVLMSSRATTTEFGKDLALTLSQRSFEELLLKRIVEPVAERLEMGRWLDTPLHSLLARLKDANAQHDEREFARAAGALGLSPFELEDADARRIRLLLERVPDESARLEFASAMIPETFDAVFGWSQDRVKAVRDSNRLDSLEKLHAQRPDLPNSPNLKPWKVGTYCARKARAQLGLDPATSVNGVRGLVKLLDGSHRFTLSPGTEAQPRAYLSRFRDHPVLVVREKDETASAFALARAVGDYVVFANHEIAISSLYTDRQKVTRAFAAEFMAPAEGVISMIEDDDRSHLAVAAHYGVAPNVINRQYGNNANADREDVLDDRMMA